MRLIIISRLPRGIKGENNTVPNLLLWLIGINGFVCASCDRVFRLWQYRTGKVAEIEKKEERREEWAGEDEGKA